MNVLSPDQNDKDILHGKTYRVYRFIIGQNGPVGIREIQRRLGFSSPSLASYHVEKLKEAGLIKEERTGYVADKVLLTNLVRFRSMLIPRYFFYFVFFTLGAALELSIFRPTVISREYAIAVLFTVIAAVAFGTEAYSNWALTRASPIKENSKDTLSKSES